MNKKGGLAVFFEQEKVTSEELAEFSYTGFKAIAVHNAIGEGDIQKVAAELLKKDGIEVIFAPSFADDFCQECKTQGIETITVTSKDMEDLLHTFADKDAEVFIVETDEGTKKVKAISGSLSKSYPL